MLNRCRKYWEVDKTFCDTKKLKRMQIQLCKSSFTNEIFSSKSNPSNTRDITLHLIYGITLYIFRWQKLFQQETIFIEVQVARSLVFCFVFCKSFFVLFFFVHFVVSFNLQILITHWVSSNSSYLYIQRKQKQNDVYNSLYFLFHKGK
jgi:hypothetical protein